MSESSADRRKPHRRRKRLDDSSLLDLRSMSQNDRVNLLMGRHRQDRHECKVSRRKEENGHHRGSDLSGWHAMEVASRASRYRRRASPPQEMSPVFSESSHKHRKHRKKKHDQRDARETHKRHRKRRSFADSSDTKRRSTRRRKSKHHRRADSTDSADSELFRRDNRVKASRHFRRPREPSCASYQEDVLSSDCGSSSGTYRYERHRKNLAVAREEAARREGARTARGDRTVRRKHRDSTEEPRCKEADKKKLEVQFAVYQKIPKVDIEPFVCGDCPELGGSVDPEVVLRKGKPLHLSSSRDVYESDFVPITSRQEGHSISYLFYTMQGDHVVSVELAKTIKCICRTFKIDRNPDGSRRTGQFCLRAETFGCIGTKENGLIPAEQVHEDPEDFNESSFDGAL